MRALRILIVLLPFVAAAEWRSLGASAPATQDLYFVDAGHLLVTSSGLDGGVRSFVFDDAGVTSDYLPGTSFIGGAVLSDGCLVGVNTSNGTTSTSPGCMVPTSFSPGTWQRFRRLSADLGVGVATGTFDGFVVGPFDGGVWSVQGPPVNSSGQRSLQAARIGGAEIVVLVSPTSNTLRMSIDAGAPVFLDAGVGAQLREAVPFERLGRVAVLAHVNGALRLIPDVERSASEVPSVPAGQLAIFLGMSGNLGLATTSSGSVLSPVPDPARPASTWVVRSGVPASMTSRVHCLDGRRCAVVAQSGEVFLYENRSRPALSIDVPPFFDAGAVIRLSADAGDPDNDPIFVRWSVDGGVVTQLVADGTSADLLVPSGACIDAITATVTDGFDAFDRSVTIPVTVIDRGGLELVAPVGPVPAGAAPVPFTAGIDGGCNTPTRIDWSSSDGQTGSGSSFNFAVPTTECSSTGRQVTITATASWPTGAPATTSSATTITIEPWGAPTTPQFPIPAMQMPGTTQLWSPVGNEHACATSPGFPGTELLWTIDAGGLSATPVDGGLLVTAPATCEPLRLVASAVRQVTGEMAGRVSDAGLLVIDVAPDLSPLGPATPVAITVGGDAGIVFGSIDAGVSCIDARGVSADIVLSQDGTQVASSTVGVPSAWSFTVPGGCAGGTYDVEARLLQDGGFTGAVVTGEVTLAEAPVAIGSLDVGRLDVQCGMGAAGPVTLEPVPGACGSAEYRWRALSGPQLEVTEGVGASLMVQTTARDFSLVGQPLVLEWTADAGAGNTAVATRTIELGVQPFIEVSARANPPLRREEEPVTFEITLRNQSACAVSGLAITVPVSGGTPLLDTVLVDGVRTPAQNTNDGIFLADMSLPASGEAHIQLSVRPRLLGEVSVTPLVALQGYVVSISSVSGPAPTGCGCTTIEPAWLLAGLALLLRRRTRASR